MATNEERVQEIIADRRSAYFEALNLALESRDNLEDWKGQTAHAASADRNVSDDYLGRYPFELIQNVQDSHKNSGITGRARFVISDESLIVADDGDGFIGEKIRSLFFLAFGSKKVGESIGHKGLGFISVLKISHGPQFFQNDISWEFNEERLRDLVFTLAPELPTNFPFRNSFAFPFDIIDKDFGQDFQSIQQIQNDGFRMIIRLPYRPGVDATMIRPHLESATDSQSLIYLPNISEIQIVDSGVFETVKMLDRAIRRYF